MPTDIDIHDLDPSVLQDLKGLSRDNAETVAKHMIMAAVLLEEDPQLALRHARAAKDRGGRVAVVRETAGIIAYHAGEWKEALSELRAARRMSGGPGMLAVIADCERALGRPEKALDTTRDESARELGKADRIELAIVAAGARRDLGDADGAVVALETLDPQSTPADIAELRLAYAYADALANAGHTQRAATWFAHVAEADEHQLTDAAERAAHA